ncbi:glycosyltransferase [Siansivirga zeaxanthinifaciens]|uniref:Glycosyltransferase n=1 Tax=Siansivirga zeaxanthinifaciens CC-SAMT-1 TaxID=1454006 RepID=A0A0C5W658_9FLAO|nr:glycosyltransferase [Siansivirga zeaxanthinifaciens]AJR02623.1 glycosyltransferase [Siansivirga zeaxanthinifaciens CC-SAMT-1]
MKKRILVAPLNWGLGHATRSIPIINALITHNFEPIIASDGVALTLLQKEFPNLISVELPSYNVTYAKKGKFFKLKIIKDAPKLLKAIKSEKKATIQLIETYKIDGIISDNRLGVYSKHIPSVFITHQLKVLSGTTTWFSTKIHEEFIRKFDACWVPDVKKLPNLSGKLGHPETFEIPTEYIGALSRFEKKDGPVLNDMLVLLSGPEPQRTFLEEKLISELKNYKGTVVFVKGIMQAEQTTEVINNITFYNFMTSSLLEKTINESALIISRSGYTTVMDLAKLGKKAFFIPTPGQFEQEYLAKRLTELKLVPSCAQDDFNLNKLENMDTFKGLKAINFNTDFKKLFSLFESE